MIFDYFNKEKICQINEYIDKNGRDSKILNLETELLKSGSKAELFNYAKEIKKADIESIQKRIIEINDSDYIYFFARDIKGADINLLQDALINREHTSEDVWYCYLFARFIGGANKDKLQNVVIKYGNEETIEAYKKWVEGVNIELLNNALEKLIKKKSPKTRINKESKFWELAERLAKVGAKLLPSKTKTFSKIGGYPEVDKNFVWPKINDKEIPFFMQLDFFEVNKNGKLANFPRNGYLYVFIDEYGVNKALDNQYKFIYIDNVDKNNLNEFKFTGRVYKEINLKFELFKSYPYYEETSELLDLFDELSEEEQDNYLDKYCFVNDKYGTLGGWPQIMQTSYLPDDYAQILQLESKNGYMWGDVGLLQFYADISDIKNCNFENVKMNLETT